jgi:hypothetical protein
MIDVLLDSVWLGPCLWVFLYVSDYCLTLACVRMYQAQDKIVFEGSYEITPLFQADVNALRRVSPRFVIALIATTGYVFLAQKLEGPSSGLYLGVLGAMVLAELTVHIRHLRNWFTFRYGVAFMQGRLVYPRGFLLRVSALELLLFAALYLVLFLATGSFFILGGAIASGTLSLSHYRLARRHDATLSTGANQGLHQTLA